MGPPQWSDYLDRVYYNVRNPGSFQSYRKLHQTVGKHGRYQLGTSRLRRWLQNQHPYSRNKLHLPKAIERARVIVMGLHDQYDADLADFQHLANANDGMRYILVVIDVFSRVTWAEAIRDKSNVEVIAAFERIFRRGHVPRRLRTDNGKEFTARSMETFYDRHNITHFVAMNEVKANYAERVIKTLKSKIYRYMTLVGTARYVDVLQDVVHSYNHTRHSTIHMSPSEVSADNASGLWWRQYHQGMKSFANTSRVPHFKYAIGEHVRIPQVSTAFSREYDARWTEEIFLITDRFRRDRTINMYKVSDGDGEPVYGTFYEMELQRVAPNQDNPWEIERIVKQRGNGARREALVSFRGWPAFYNRWIPYTVAHNALTARG